MFRLDQAIECLKHDAPLKLAVKGHAKMMPHHKGHEDGAGRFDMLCNVKRHRDGHRGNTPSLNSALHERD